MNLTLGQQVYVVKKVSEWLATCWPVRVIAASDTVVCFASENTDRVNFCKPDEVCPTHEAALARKHQLERSGDQQRANTEGGAE